jgi:ParB-like chromosome segregation protein Spo0J
MSGYRSRVIGWAEVQAEQLCANPDNWRIHPHYQHDAIAASVEEVGWVAPIIVNNNTGNVVDGHLRVLVALDRGDQQTLPVVYVDLTDEEERLMLATLDPSAQFAIADKEKLASLLLELKPNSDILNDLLRAVGKMNKVKLDGLTGAVVDPSLQPQAHVCVCPNCGQTHYKIEEMDHGEKEEG